MTDAWKLQMTSQVLALARYSGRTTDTDRTSDALQPPDDRAPPDDRHHRHKTKMKDVWRPSDN